MKISQLLNPEYKSLQYLLTLPPMSKIKAVSEDGKDYFTIFGKKGLYEFAGKKDLTMQELINYLPKYNAKYKFEIEFEEAPHDYVSEAKTLQSIIQRNPKPELIDKLREVTLKTNSPSLCYDYAKEFMNGRFLEAEPIILKGLDSWDRRDYEATYKYARDIIKERWSELEKRLLRTESRMDLAVMYARDIIKERWPELERELLQFHKEIMDKDFSRYCIDVIGGRWPEGERKLLSKIDYFTAFKDDSREVISLRNTAYEYCKTVLKGPWEEMERYFAYDERLFNTYKRQMKSFESGMSSTVNLNSKALSAYLKRGEEFLKKYRNAQYHSGEKYYCHDDKSCLVDLKTELNNIPPHHREGFLLYFANCQMNGSILPDPKKVRISTLEKWTDAKGIIDKMRSKQNVG